jgi:hypothetical protein
MKLYFTILILWSIEATMFAFDTDKINDRNELLDIIKTDYKQLILEYSGKSALSNNIKVINLLAISKDKVLNVDYRVKALLILSVFEKLDKSSLNSIIELTEDQSPKIVIAALSSIYNHLNTLDADSLEKILTKYAESDNAALIFCTRFVSDKKNDKLKKKMIQTVKKSSKITEEKRSFLLQILETENLDDLMKIIEEQEAKLESSDDSKE